MSFIINPYIHGVVAASSWAGSAIDPDDETGLTGWWKADALTGLSDNDPISSWPTAGSGGAGYEFVQTLTARPTYKTGGPNGLPYATFDGSNDQMATALSTPMNDSASTVIAVIAPNSPPTNAFKCIVRTRKYGFHYATDTNAFGTYFGQTVVGNALPASATWAILVMVYRAHNDVDLYSLGVKVTRTNGTAADNGTWNYLGAGTDGAQHFSNMSLGELCYYNVAKSESAVRNVAEGLVAKWSAV